MTEALNSHMTKYVVLGDSLHGEKSLKCLAKAVQDGALRRLKDYGVSTVLLEGTTKGKEKKAEHGVYARAVKILRDGKVRVIGCEDKYSLSTFGDLDRLQLGAGDMDPAAYMSKQDELLGRRILDANDTWVKQILKCKAKVILCCGTSHVARFSNAQTGQRDLGLEVRLSFKGRCCGYALEASNSGQGDGYYYPEKATGQFGTVTAIDAYPGWDAL